MNGLAVGMYVAVVMLTGGFTWIIRDLSLSFTEKARTPIWRRWAYILAAIFWPVGIPVFALLGVYVWLRSVVWMFGVLCLWLIGKEAKR